MLTQKLQQVLSITLNFCACFMLIGKDHTEFAELGEGHSQGVHGVTGLWPEKLCEVTPGFFSFNGKVCHQKEGFFTVELDARDLKFP